MKATTSLLIFLISFTFFIPIFSIIRIKSSLFPKISDIVGNPQRFENKFVILKVKPGGWSCPVNKSTSIPPVFSRSATMIYDDSGCLYGAGKIIYGKLLVPEKHKIYEPGNETLIIIGVIKISNGIPYIS